jgi:hypothetical protein
MKHLRNNYGHWQYPWWMGVVLAPAFLVDRAIQKTKHLVRKAKKKLKGKKNG